MITKPIITSLLDTDFYKLTMGQVVYHRFSSMNVRYKFKCRNKDVVWSEEIHGKEIRNQIENFASLRFTEDELIYLSKIRFFKDSYINFLRTYQPDANHVRVEIKDGELDISIYGPWAQTIYWEVPLLAIVNEVYFSSHFNNSDVEYAEGLNRLKRKINIANCNDIKFAEFGTRRRISKDWHERVVMEIVQRSRTFAGTSNLLLSKRFHTLPIGTMAHEFIQAGQAIAPLKDSQKVMLQEWADEYRGDLGIALTDTIGIDAFLLDFDLYFAKLYDGVRHDSGNPYEWGEKVLRHYNDFGIDTLTKTLVFSDGLDMDSAFDINSYFGRRANISFGIGTNLTNDIIDLPPLQIVIKMVMADGFPVAKLSDNPTKIMCEDEGHISSLRRAFNID